MRSASAVIGAAFGDEGKGLFTDYLTRAEKADLVVKFSGGAQAGHTVVSPNNVPHVFHTLGSGSFRGARTYLSPFFVFHPANFLDELRFFNLFHQTPAEKPILDETCVITTYFDEIINRSIEAQRGSDRHGSCGLGVGETIERTSNSAIHKYSIFARHLRDLANVKEKLTFIHDEWVPYRLKALELSAENLIVPAEELKSHIPIMLEVFETVKSKVSISRADVSSYNNWIFEGSQGLALDQHSRYFPYVTRSSTGCVNVFAIASYFNIKHLNLYYVTRAYRTRHGAGPLFGELGRKPYVDVRDNTNTENQWQGKLRYAYLSPDELKEFIDDDLQRADHFKKQTGITFTPKLVVTCLDQVGRWVMLDTGEHIVTKNLAKELSDRVGIKVSHVSYGPAAKDVRKVKLR